MNHFAQILLLSLAASVAAPAIPRALREREAMRCFGGAEPKRLGSMPEERDTDSPWWEQAEPPVPTTD